MTYQRSASYSFLDSTPKATQVEARKSLDDFQRLVDDFGKDEPFVRHVLEAAKTNNNDVLRATSTKYSLWASGFWQTKDWFWALRNVVPILVLELTKHQPASKELVKAHAFFAKIWKWQPKTMNHLVEVPTKYLAVLKDLRTFLAAAQKAAASIGKQDAPSIRVGRFDLYDGMGAGTKALDRAKEVLQEATTAMARMGLGEFCYGRVTLVDSASFASKSSAFYVANTDEVFVSPDIGEQDVRAVIHELAHRVYYKLSLRDQAEEMYGTVKQRGLWVTNYAKTDALENFAEMVSFAAIGKLTEEARPLLEAVTRKIKVASRFLGWSL